MKKPKPPMLESSGVHVIARMRGGDCHSVLLSKDGQKYVLNLLSQLHDGKLRVSDKVLPFTIEDKHEKA